jgi:hypothetical protein
VAGVEASATEGSGSRRLPPVFKPGADWDFANEPGADTDDGPLPAWLENASVPGPPPSIQTSIRWHRSGISESSPGVGDSESNRGQAAGSRTAFDAAPVCTA